MNEKTNNKLSNDPAELIRMAASDLREVTRREGVVVNTKNWLRRKSSGGLSVCLGGAVMLNRLNGLERLSAVEPKERGLWLHDFEPEQAMKLRWLEDIRTLDWGGNLFEIGFANHDSDAIWDELHSKKLLRKWKEIDDEMSRSDVIYFCAELEIVADIIDYHRLDSVKQRNKMAIYALESWLDDNVGMESDFKIETEEGSFNSKELHDALLELITRKK